MTQTAHTSVQDYYGRILQKSEDLKTSACCVAESPPDWLKNPLSKISDRVMERFYGCGFPIAEAVKDATVLDLGCGSGRDVYLFAQLVGPNGFVHGIDMTKAQLEVARSTEDFHTKEFGYQKSNVAFHEGLIEDLSAIEDSSIDLTISNCVLNLSPRKDLVLKEVMRVLKPGGEFLFSDVFSSRRLPAWMMEDQVLLGECLGGAIYQNDFIPMAREAGFRDPRRLTESPVDLRDEDVLRKVQGTEFLSITWRLFKLENLDYGSEDYGQLATYQNPIPGVGPYFQLDTENTFELGRPERVCANTADMLAKTRLASFFEVTGQKEKHFGRFPRTSTIAARPNQPTPEAKAPTSCC